MNLWDMLGGLGSGIHIVIVASMLTNRISAWKGIGYMVPGFVFVLPRNLLMHNTLGVSIDVAFIIWGTWIWWNGGGGDDTKRRLRKLAEKFEGVRRTAPQAA